MAIVPPCVIAEAKYATLIDLIRHFGTKELIQITDRSGGNADQNLLTKIANCQTITINNNLLAIYATMKVAEILAEQAREVDEIVDSYLANIYQIPIQPPYPKILTIQACQIVRYYLYKDGVIEDNFVINRLYESALAKLEKIMNRELVINLDQHPTIEFSSTRNDWTF